MIRVPSPAKLNLFLHITARRADGYHELQTIFQLIDLYDWMEFQQTDDLDFEKRCRFSLLLPKYYLR